MLFLNPDSTKITNAKKAFHDGMLEFVLGRIERIKDIKDINVRNAEIFFDKIIDTYINDILIGEPNILVKINADVNPFLESVPDFKNAVKYVFNYDLFIKKSKKRYDAYKLAESLDINTCTYCNRNYTNTVVRSDGKKLTRPQFDHFFDKASNPLLALSFFNMIPSCSICNSDIKGAATMNLYNYLHPYIDNNTNDIRFKYKYSDKTKSGLKIVVDTPVNSKSRRTIEVFAIEEVYNSHTGELADLIKLRQYFSDKYLTILSSNLLRNVIVSKEDLYRIVFGTEYDSINFINKPFSKFKSDILTELGVI